MITVLIVAGVCWFVLALLFVLALGLSARRKPPPLGSEQVAIEDSIPSMPERRVRVQRRFWARCCHPKAAS